MRLLSPLLLPVLLPALAAALAAQAPAPDLKQNPAAARAPLNPALPTLFIAGDSTAARSGGATSQGWGVPFADYFDAAKVNVANRARGGRSSRTFVTEGLWAQLMADLKAGDIVLIQFGHNDASPVNEEESVPVAARRARGSLPGLGDETRAIDNIITKKPEVVRTFGAYLRQMIAETRAKGATPIVLSLTLRNVWKDGKIERGTRHSRWSAEVAAAAGVAFLDLNTTVADRFDALGEAAVKALYPQDHTHFSLAGADLHAAAVVAALKAMPALPVEKFLSAKGAAVPSLSL